MPTSLWLPISTDMANFMTKRKYEKTKRAANQEETRKRIVEATVQLHQTIGGPAATISAIAEAAGVERLTVYRHFPDERSLLQACTGHYLSLNQPPDPESWLAIADPVTRLGTALRDIYAYHLQTEAMMNSAFRDIDTMPVLKDLLQPLFAYWRSVATLLADGLAETEAGKQAILPMVALSIHYLTWRTLVREQGLSNDAAVDLMFNAIRCLMH